MKTVAVDPIRQHIVNKLMGPTDGPNKLAEIAKTSGNPEIRKMAAQMLQEQRARASDADLSAFGAGQ